MYLKLFMHSQLHPTTTFVGWRPWHPLDTTSSIVFLLVTQSPILTLFDRIVHPSVLHFTVFTRYATFSASSTRTYTLPVYCWQRWKTGERLLLLMDLLVLVLKKGTWAIPYGDRWGAGGQIVTVLFILSRLRSVPFCRVVSWTSGACVTHVLWIVLVSSSLAQLVQFLTGRASDGPIYTDARKTESTRNCRGNQESTF